MNQCHSGNSQRGHRQGHGSRKDFNPQHHHFSVFASGLFVIVTTNRWLMGPAPMSVLYFNMAHAQVNNIIFCYLPVNSQNQPEH